MRKPDEIRISMFCYETSFFGLFSTWAQSHASLVFSSEGRILSELLFLGEALNGDVLQQGKLRINVIPFVAQERYDELLWACDINFVQGKTLLYAQWAE